MISKDGMLTHVTHRAMATNFVVLLPGAANPNVEAAMEALEAIDEVEQRLTVYRPTSEISRVNANSGSNPVKVHRKTFSLIQRSIEWCRASGGALDITIGPLVKAWGFETRSGRKPSQEEISSAKELVNFELIELDDTKMTVRLPKSGMSLNLGSIGKGEALDEIKRHLVHAGVQDFLIHGGASSVLAKGSQAAGDGDTETTQGWAVGIAHPRVAETRVVGIWLKDAAIGTSGSGKQFFHHRGRRYSHVIDPRSGYPTTDEIWSLTACCGSAAQADAMATGLFVGDANRADGTEYLAVKPTGEGQEVVWEGSEGWNFVEE
ncbi:MAG: FAD:protein FMN transferase [Planctomycetota bacterium]